MRKLLIPLLAALALPTAVNANVESEVHKLCLPAADYLGCVKAMTGNSNPIEVITNPGTATAKGNACPVGYAYIGKGYCSQVFCTDRTTELGIANDEILAGKKWKCQTSFLSLMTLVLGRDTARIGDDPNCPKGEPSLGWTSTCEAPYEEPPKDERTFGLRR